MRRFLPLLLLAGCATPLTAPPQPTPASLVTLNNQLALLVHADGTPLSGVETWQIGSYAVRAGCHAYLNAAATQQKDLAVGGLGLGMLGAGLALAHPLAGVASSLAQTALTAYSTSGPVPTTADAILIIESMDTYETGVNQTALVSAGQAIGFVDDLWFLCSPGGSAITELKAKTTAQMGLMFNGRPSVAPNSVYLGRPVVTVNPPAAQYPQMNLDTITNPEPEPATPAPPRWHHRARTTPAAPHPANLSDDPDWPRRRALLRATWRYIPALDGPR